jgi:hypothetical protein
MFTISIDRARLLVDMRLSGFFTLEIAAQATQALRAAVRSLGPAMGHHVTLYDATDLLVSPAQTIEYIQSSYAEPEIRPLWARRVAYCTPSALTRMQAMRLRRSRADIGVFTTRDDALAWLLEVSASRDRPAA